MYWATGSGWTVLGDGEPDGLGDVVVPGCTKIVTDPVGSTALPRLGLGLPYRAWRGTWRAWLDDDLVGQVRLALSLVMRVAPAQPASAGTLTPPPETLSTIGVLSDIVWPADGLVLTTLAAGERQARPPGSGSCVTFLKPAFFSWALGVGHAHAVTRRAGPCEPGLDVVVQHDGAALLATLVPPDGVVLVTVLYGPLSDLCDDQPELQMRLMVQPVSAAGSFMPLTGCWAPRRNCLCC